MAKCAAEPAGRRLVGLLGGTFDPIHHGHLRMAEQLADALLLDEVRFIPCANPPHRETPLTSAADRSAMVRLAIAGNPRFMLDERELQRSGASYTIDTLLSLRAELGDETALCLFMGSDAFIDFDRWHRWREIPGLCHIVLVERPDAPMTAALRPELQALLRERGTDQGSALTACAAGHVMIQHIHALNISATAIRDDLHAKRSPRYLLPDVVLDFIRSRQLYR